MSLEETLEAMQEFFLEHKDPVRKAERATEKKSAVVPAPKSGGVVSVPRRKPIPASVRHQVFLRDRGKCTICGSTRFPEIHHKREVAHGGADTLANLVTLCSAHHAYDHETWNPQLSGDSSQIRVFSPI